MRSAVFLAAGGTMLLLLSAGVRGQEHPPAPAPPAPAPGSVDWPAPEGPLSAPVEDKRNTPEKARAAALQWLARHQSKGGAFDPAKFDARCKVLKCPGRGEGDYAIGLTGLAVVAFLRAGTLPGPDAEGASLEAALRFLRTTQDGEGCFGEARTGHFLYNHAIATLAVCEASAKTSDPALGTAAKRAVDFIRSAQKPYKGWRYEVKDEMNDTSATAWMVQALRAGTMAGLDVEPRVFDGAKSFLDDVTDAETGRSGYLKKGDFPGREEAMMTKFPGAMSESSTGAAMLARLLCGQEPKEEILRKGADILLKRLPEWNTTRGTIDLYYWYYGTEVEARLGKEGWKKWSAALKASLLPWQRGEKSGCAEGSWDPVDPWEKTGGRLYMTVMGALMVERLCEKH